MENKTYRESKLYLQRVKKSESGDGMEVGSAEEVKPVEQIHQPKLLSGGTLRDYQLEGYNWLKVIIVPSNS